MRKPKSTSSRASSSLSDRTSSLAGSRRPTLRGASDADALGARPRRSQPAGTAPTTPSRSAVAETRTQEAQRYHGRRRDRASYAGRSTIARAAQGTSGRRRCSIRFACRVGIVPTSQENGRQTSAAAIPNSQALASAAEISGPISHASPSSDRPARIRDVTYRLEPRTPPSRTAERPPKTPKSVASIPNTPRRVCGLENSRSCLEGTIAARAGLAATVGSIQRRPSRVSTSSSGSRDAQPRRCRSLAHHASRKTRAAFPPPGGDPTYYSREPPHRGMGYPPPLSVATQRGPEYDPYGHAAPPYPVQSSPLRMAHESPKRRRVSSAAFDFEPYGSPFLGERQPRIRTQTEGADPFMQGRPYHDYAPSGPPSAGGSQVLSALDLLADQATASQNPSQGSDKSGEYEGVSPSAASAATTRWRWDGEPRRKSGSRLSSSRAQDGSRGSKSGGSQGASRNGEGKSFGGNQNPERGCRTYDGPRRRTQSFAPPSRSTDNAGSSSRVRWARGLIINVDSDIC